MKKLHLKESLFEAKKKPSYGGAFDIEDDQFFTREELDEFGYDIADNLSERFNSKFEYNGAYIEDGDRLEVDIASEEFGEYTASVRIDMRKIRKPSDLSKYQIYIMDDFTTQLSSAMKDYYGESLNEDSDSSDIKIDSWQNGLEYDPKSGCIIASKEVYDDWE